MVSDCEKVVEFSRNLIQSVTGHNIVLVFFLFHLFICFLFVCV